MLEINVKFQEEYKELDSLCRDIFSGGEGISQYIRRMESVLGQEYRFMSTWEYDYKQLKHMRWLRNRLAHEVGTLDSDLCTKDDIAWLENFHKKILEGNDPLAVIGRVMRQQKNIQKNSVVGSETFRQKIYNENNINREVSKSSQRNSIWEKIAIKIRSIFGK